MITLYISSGVQTTTDHIAMLIAEGGSECQVSQNCSAYKNGDSCVRETGYMIKLFGVEKDDFKKKIWEVLQPYLSLRCAHVTYINEYQGCVLNWPGVFTESNCKWEKESITCSGHSIRCGICGEERDRDQFSKTQRKKKQHERKCNACIGT